MLSAKLRPLDPYQSARSRWRCECLVCGEIGTPTYGNVMARGTGCWSCRSRKIGDRLRGDTSEAIAAMRAVGLEPLEPYRNIDHAWPCRCVNCGREVAPTLWSVKSRGSGCGYCSGNRIDDEDAVSTMRAAGLEPQEPYPGKAILPWRCRCGVCGREVSPSYNSVQQGQSGCAFCAGNRVDPHEARATMELAGLIPFIEFPGAHMPWPSTCAVCEKQVTPTYSSVAQGRGCRFCGLERTAQARRGDPVHAAEVMRNAGLEPAVEYPGSREKWLCRCIACGNDVTPTYDSVNQGGGGCVFCVSGGYDPHSPGAVYLMRHDALEAYKVGIRNLTSRRLERHVRNGWYLVEEWQFNDGSVPPKVEVGILGWWRGDLEAPVACTPEQMPQAGYTETVSMAHVSEEATRSMVLALA